jgi:hypothetical protein
MLSIKPITSSRLYTVGPASTTTSSRFVPVYRSLGPTSSQNVSVFPLKLEAKSKEEAFPENFDKRTKRDDEEERGIAGIHVPRQRYIAVAKAELLDAVIDLFDSDQDKEDFRRFARYPRHSINHFSCWIFNQPYKLMMLFCIWLISFIPSETIKKG